MSTGHESYQHLDREFEPLGPPISSYNQMKPAEPNHRWHVFLHELAHVDLCEWTQLKKASGQMAFLPKGQPNIFSSKHDSNQQINQQIIQTSPNSTSQRFWVPLNFPQQNEQPPHRVRVEAGLLLRPHRPQVGVEDGLHGGVEELVQEVEEVLKSGTFYTTGDQLFLTSKSFFENSFVKLSGILEVEL